MNNNNHEIISVLTEYGLNQREAALYLAGLEMGECGMAPIAKKAGIKRPTAYLTFKTLEQKGLMGSFKMRNGLRFVTTKPDVLVARAKVKAKNLESIIPNINAIMGSGSYKPKISYYEGREGFFTAIENCFKNPNSTLRHIGSLKETHKVVGEDYDFNYFIPKRVKNNIRMKALYFPDVTQKITTRNDEAELREMRFLPMKYNNNTSTLIMDDRIIISGGSKELIVVVIESKEIAFSEKQKFDLIWDLVGEKK
jgi:HTH-type transcriptional regulator, sugar sensing transcriptional regulator